MCVPRTSSERRKAVQNAIDGVNDLITVTGPSLHVVHEGGKKLSQKILTTKKLATKVTGRVRQLNSCRSRAQAALDHVNGILGLKGCVVGVQTSMRNGDLRQAAEYVYKYRNAGDSAEGLTPASDAQLMSATESELREAVLAKLEEAVMGIDEKAEEAVVEYCSLFALLGLAREGLSRYCQFLSKAVSATFEEELLLANIERASMRRGYMAPHGTNFVDLLSKLYNDSAAAMQRAEAVVLSMPGFEREMPAPFLISALHKQCDADASRTLSTFIASRHLPARSAIALDDTNAECAQQIITADPMAPFTEDHLSALDALLDEIALVHQHTESYDRFVRAGYAAALVSARSALSPGADAANPPALPSSCEYNNVVQEIAGFYTIIEGAFIRDSAAKALGMEETCPVADSAFGHVEGIDDGDASIASSGDSILQVSTTVEDVFWILKKSLSRAMATGVIDCVCGVLNNAAATLQRDFVSLMQFRVGKMKSDVQTLTQQGKAQLERLRGIVKQRARSPSGSPSRALTPSGAPDGLDSPAFTLNSIALASSYAQNLYESVKDDADEALEPTDAQRAKLLGCAEGLRDCARELDSTLMGALDKVCGTFKARLKSFLDTTISADECTYEIDEEAFAITEASNPFIEGLIDVLEGVLAPITSSLSRANITKLVHRVSIYLAKTYERAIVRKRFTLLGALKMEREVRAMSVYFSSKAGADVRKAVLARLVEIATILTVDAVADVHDVWTPSMTAGTVGGVQSPTLRLKSKEIKRVLALRVDLAPSDIKQLKL